jgi:hypothetical protein
MRDVERAARYVGALLSGVLHDTTPLFREDRPLDPFRLTDHRIMTAWVRRVSAFSIVRLSSCYLLVEVSLITFCLSFTVPCPSLSVDRHNTLIPATIPLVLSSPLSVKILLVFCGLLFWHSLPRGHTQLPCIWTAWWASSYRVPAPACGSVLRVNVMDDHQAA